MRSSPALLVLVVGCVSLLSFASPVVPLSEAAAGPGASAPGTPAISAPDLRSRYVEGVGGVPLNVIEAGKLGKPTIVFIHGLGQSHLSWQFQLQSALADEYHLVAYDLRGHGNSGKPWLESDYAAPDVWAGDLERVLAATGAQDPLIVSWSYGTWVAVDYLKTHRPETISGLIMVGGLGGLIAPPPLSSLKPSEEGLRLSRLRASGWLGDNFVSGKGVNRFFVRKPVDPTWEDRTAAVNAMLPPYARPLLMARSWDNSDAVDRIRMPTLLMVGSEDVTLPVPDAKSLRQRLPDAQLQIFEGSGHLVFAEDPKKFNEMLRQFAQKAFTER